MNKKKNLLIIFVLLLITVLNAQYSLKIGNVYPGEVEIGGFSLAQNSHIEITGEAASFGEWNNYLEYYAWIVKTDTREVVWQSKNCEDYNKSDGEYDLDSEIKLKSGNYEVYFAAANDKNKSLDNGGVIFLNGLFNKKKLNINEYYKNFFVKIYSDRGLKIKNGYNLVDGRNKNAIVSLIRVGDDEKLTKSFSLNADTKIKIYGLGEGTKREFYDFGYIYDVVNNKIVWTFNREDKHYAGGGKKNIKEEAEILLPKGSYTVIYKTDNSHSFDEWNTLPPNDPQYWGITLFLKNENDKDNIIPFNKNDIVEPVIKITEVEDDELISKGFTLKKPLKLRVFVIGEGEHHKLADYGWIENADTKEIVWEMDYDKTEHAGGAKKNRISDEIIELDAGNYIAFYKTDDSHNYGDWNKTPPYLEEKWGISIYTINKKDKAYIKAFATRKYVNKSIIAEIVKVGDNKELDKDFTLKRDSYVKIIAIGESRGNKLVDYAWITNNSGKIVWEMTFSETKHAGGALKNRIFNDTIKLKAGKYTLHYKTDSFHSYEGWNSIPPSRPEMYGVTLLEIGE